jgi:hypothetical protein
MTLEEIEAQDASGKTAYDLALAFDEEYQQKRRRIMQPGPDEMTSCKIPSSKTLFKASGCWRSS